MKAFWSENGRTIGKCLLNQFGSAFFGIMLFTAASAVKSVEWLVVLASVISILFYMYLLYNLLWDRGGQDRIKSDGGRADKNLYKGLLISLIANIPNFILAIIIMITYPMGSTNEAAATVCVVAKTIALLWEGMYNGIVQYFSPYNPIIYLLMILPAIIVCTVAYIMGFSNKRIFGNLFVKKKKE